MSRKRIPAKAVAAMTRDGPQSPTALNRLIETSSSMVRGGTRAVPGEGPLHPDIALAGEPPGDQEYLPGRPFVGPAGQLLDRALMLGHALDATAVAALTGKALPIAQNRGPAGLDGRVGVVTMHPSYLLRLREGRETTVRAFVADQKTAGKPASRAKAA